MKVVNIWLTDKEHKDLVRKKDGLTWKEFVLQLIKLKQEVQ